MSDVGNDGDDHVTFSATLKLIRIVKKNGPRCTVKAFDKKVFLFFF